MCSGKYMWKSMSSKQDFVTATSCKNQIRLTNATFLLLIAIPPPPPSPLPSWETEPNCFDFCLAFSEVLDYRPIRRNVLCVGLLEIKGTNELTNQQRFSMVYTLIDHGLSTIEIRSKCSKLKWNHELQAIGFTAQFWTFWRHSPWNCCQIVFSLILLTVSLPWRQFPAKSLGK